MKLDNLGGLSSFIEARHGPQRGGQMTSGDSLRGAGGKRPRTMDCGTPYKRPMSSSGRQLVEMMTMMMVHLECLPREIEKAFSRHARPNLDCIIAFPQA
ncbi:jg15015 [Pararge aegeria aegeria]|uniref:Jg15015 protein n=1 Tax=Pararge aegeria aegeria TaxID=348720 RepID=A0A8S4RCH3_9NEOP|nr:jg15015 [Pararge aegeria aegeria]